MAKASVSVLLVDDNPTFRRVADKFLRTLPGLVVAGTAVGGLDGLAQAETLQPDVILVDLHMRDLDGLRLIPQLRALLPQTNIIALTLLEASAFRGVTLAAGADEFVDKANMFAELWPAIERVRQRSGH
ncbi:MAG: response regulator transcription factor [Acidobacteria bacterium]|nr:response regulator transcription factor [Acidobacteriota bacterium]MBI3425804.1 response regulator transcription factor [Acidobacteriota bacterium]